jgi:hypothetical protein
LVSCILGSSESLGPLAAELGEGVRPCLTSWFRVKLCFSSKERYFSHRPVVARLPEICSTWSRRPREDLLINEDQNPEAKREFLTAGDATIQKGFLFTR